MDKLRTGWNVLRVLRLVMGTFAAIQAFAIGSIFMGAIAAILFYQVYANVGCCNYNPVYKENQNEDIHFEEIKP